jgi:hypothetical protein
MLVLVFCLMLFGIQINYLDNCYGTMNCVSDGSGILLASKNLITR